MQFLKNIVYSHLVESMDEESIDIESRLHLNPEHNNFQRHEIFIIPDPILNHKANFNIAKKNQH